MLDRSKVPLVWMLRALAILGAMALSVQPQLAQTKTKATAAPQFEVASVRQTPANASPVAGQDRFWGEGDGRVVLRRIPLKFVLLEAFGIQAGQLHGPAWLDDVPFDIIANAPVGTPKAQIRLMMQALLQDRFKMKFHRETENRTVNLLTVRKEGHRLKETVAGTTSGGALPEENGAKMGKGTTLVEKVATMSSVSTGKFGRFRTVMSSGVARNEFEGIAMPQFAEYLLQLLPDLPIVDGTGLKGSYQITIESDTADALPPAVRAQLPADREPSGVLSIPEQLKKMGLELVRQRIDTEKFVIDSIDRTPTVN